MNNPGKRIQDVSYKNRKAFVSWQDLSYASFRILSVLRPYKDYDFMPSLKEKANDVLAHSACGSGD